MPIYEYQCSACGHRLEAMQKMADAPLLVCPSCKARKLTKLISAVGFRLGGSGWYETDFKSGSKRNIAEKDSTSTPAKTSDKADAPAKSAKATPAAKDSAPSST